MPWQVPPTRDIFMKPLIRIRSRLFGRVGYALLGCWPLRLLSRVVNYLRLRGLADHRRNVRRSRKILATLRSFAEPGREARSLVYLRRIDPLVFEEVLMSALEDAGALVLRSRRYSGDGGIDGSCWRPETGWYAVQVKRYSGHIDRQHVNEFAEVLRRRRYAGGIFAHTGRSGVGIYDFLPRAEIVLLSGDRLIQLMLEREMPDRSSR